MAADVQAGQSVPGPIDESGDGQPSPGFLNTVYIDFDPAIVGSTLEIPGDATREMIGFYKRNILDIVTVRAARAPESATFVMSDIGDLYEFRRSTHGPMVTDGFTIFTGGGGTCTIMIVNRQGAQ